MPPVQYEPRGHLTPAEAALPSGQKLPLTAAQGAGAGDAPEQKLPIGQRIGWLELPAQKKPGAHGEPAAAVLAAEQKNPDVAAQSPEQLDAERPVVAPYLPAGHSVEVVALQ